MKTYKQWVEWLETRSPMPLLKPGIEKTRSALIKANLLDRIDPKNVIHIAGTNGKGTTAKALETLLLSADQNVGLFTSPHLIDTCERIRTEGRDISQNNFVSLCEKYRPLIEELDLTHFESLTLFAADYFFNVKKVKWAIFEIGLGGTWDSTNVIPHSTSCITALGKDHMHILGDTLEEIAGNKFGIIHPHNTVFHFSYPEAVESLLSDKLRATHSRAFRVPLAQHSVDASGPTPRYVLSTTWGSTPIGLPGQRAAQNMLMALHVFQELGFSPEKHLSALAEMSWPARMTRFNTKSPCPVYLSGDHNLQGIESLVEILKNFKFKNLFIVLGTSKNRSPLEYLPTLAQLKSPTIIFTKPTFQGVTPVLPPGSLFFENPGEALHTAQNKADAQDLIVITGSLYLCGDFFRLSARGEL